MLVAFVAGGGERIVEDREVVDELEHGASVLPVWRDVFTYEVALFQLFQPGLEVSAELLFCRCRDFLTRQTGLLL